VAAVTDPADLPYLTAELPGVGGRIKEYLTDFRVDEVPLYLPSGEGTHVYFRVTKAGIPTPEAVNRVARRLDVRPHDVGFAGLKDARAVTTQMMSLEHAEPDKLVACGDDRMSVELVGRHTNKIRPGHLRGNRFVIRVRDVGSAQLDAARAILDVLVRRGVPNYFGAQRFGARGDTAALGEALVRGDSAEFAALLLGRPDADDPPDCRAARDAFDSGFLDRALKRWPRHYSNERRALAAFKRKRRGADVVRAADKRMKRLYVSAFQSAIFNEILAARIETIDRVLIGDMAQKTDTGGIFPVEDADAEQPRAERFEISPTGVVVGYRSKLAAGEPGRIEADALARHNVQPEDFRRAGPMKPKGTRRPLRFALEEPDLTAGADEHGEYLQLTFTAPSGCYATVALREIMKGGC
jgi:tRNA pseudouridine13 synthase